MYVSIEEIKELTGLKCKEKINRLSKVGWGKSWNGKRPYQFYEVSFNSKINKFFKRQVHKIERRENKKMIMDKMI